jgi:Flp pilus assembly protein TadD/ketosteroid isomerase-like protein
MTHINVLVQKIYLPRHFSVVSLVLAAVLITGLHSARADEMSAIKDLQIAGKMTEALAKVNQELGAKPKDASLRFLKGVILADTGRSAEAISIFQKLTEDNPRLPEPYNNLAVLYAANGQFDKAKLALEAAIRTNPSYATAHENLGDIYARMASEAYSKALQLDVSKTQVQTKLALIRDLSGGVTVAVAKPSAPATAAILKPVPSPAATPAASERKPPAPAPVVTPAKPVEPPKVPEPVKPAVTDTQPVEAALNAWASAWADKDMAAYIASYTPDYVPTSGGSRKAWEDDRKAKILGKSKISVRISAVNVKMEGNNAVARFRQDYSADSLRTSTRKTLTWVKRGNRWLISKEVSG